MVQSTWSDWFIEDVEATDPDGLSLWYLGCNGFILRTSQTTLYVDPYFGTGDPPMTVRMIPVPLDPGDATQCDGVLVTHEHIDHMHPPSIAPLLDLDEKTKVHGPEPAFASPDYEGGLGGIGPDTSTVERGQSLEFGDIDVHVRSANDPDSAGAVSYVFQHDTGTVIHAGDSRPASEFEQLGREFDIDVGILAFGTAGMIQFPEEESAQRTQWYMNENEVIEAANALALERLLPTHHDMWRGVGADPKSLHEHAATFPYPKVIEPVQVGDRVDTIEPGIAPVSGEN